MSAASSDISTHVPSSPVLPRRNYLPRWLAALFIVYLLGLVALTLSNLIGPERTWPGALNLYLPQWLWAIPGAILLLLTALFAWRRLWIPLLCLLWVFGPIMGFCWHLPNVMAKSDGIRLRVMTYNVKEGRPDLYAVLDDIAKYHPDLLQLQQRERNMHKMIAGVLPEWNIRVAGQYLFASRFPLSGEETLDIALPENRTYAEGAGQRCARATMLVDGMSVTLYNVHLLSPRGGLMSAEQGYSDGLANNLRERLHESRLLSGYLKQDILKQDFRPILLTGDLNGPVQSLACRWLMDEGLRDAYSEAGFGYGYSYGKYTRLHTSYLRIDHILVSRAFEVKDCFVGNETGSEHAPVIADLILTTRR